MAYIESKAPGKILWLGGYAVLEKPNMGYVTAINSYVHSKAHEIKENKISINAKGFGSIECLLNEDGGFEIKEEYEELKLLQLALKVASMYANSLGYRAKGIYIETYNDPAISYKVEKSKQDSKVVKSGFGSSAAVVVSSIASVLSIYGIDTSSYEGKEVLHKLAQLAHSLGSGKIGSGFDVASAVYGSIKYERYSPSIIENFPKDYNKWDIKKLIDSKWDYNIEKLEFPKIFKTIAASFAGQSTSTTSFVKAVNEFKKKNPEEYNLLINEIASYSNATIKSIEKINSEGVSEQLLEEFKENFDKSRIAAKKLGLAANVGIEDEEVTKIIEESKKNGAFVARTHGAGGRDSLAAICISNEKMHTLKEYWKKLEGLEVIEIRVQNNGLMQNVNKIKI